MSISLNDKKELIKSLKAVAIEVTDPGDLPFTMIFNRSGTNSLFTIISPIDMKVGSTEHLMAIGAVTMAFYPDFLIMLSDIHFQTQKVNLNEVGELKKQMERRLPPGYLHDLANTEGMYEAGLVANGILCVTATRDASFDSFIMPYSYHGKYGPYYFRWLDEVEKFKYLSEPTENDHMVISGDFYEAIKLIMKKERVKPETVVGFIGREVSENSLQASALRYLHDKGFMIMQAMI
jgi:hypothetical protein